MKLARLSALAARLMIACSLLLFAHAGLQAQTITAPTPPVRSTVDPNGVDLRTAFLNLHEPGVSIGDPGNGGLAHYRDWVTQIDNGHRVDEGLGIGGWRHAFLLTANIDYSNLNLTISGAGYSHVFTQANYSSPYVDSEHMGETLKASGQLLIYTAHDGTVITFDGTMMANFPAYTAPTSYLPTSIVKPNGEVITFTYKLSSYVATLYGYTSTYYVVRLQSVSNNYGYMLKYGYKSNDPTQSNDWLTITSVAAVNLANTYCDPAADACPGSSPAVTYANATLTDSGGASYTAWITTLPSGRSITYKYEYIADYRRTRILAIKDPASANFMTTYAYNGTDIDWAQLSTVNRDGIAYTYIEGTNPQNDGSVDFFVQATAARTTPWWANSSETYGYLKQLTMGPVTSTYNYQDTYGRLTSVAMLGAPGSVWVVYDDRGNITTSTTGNRWYGVTATYDSVCNNPKTCNRPNSVTDVFGNTTNFTYDPAHGGVLTATSPAAASGGVQPQVRTSYTQLHAYYLNSAGSIVAAPTGIYKPTGTSTCITTASCAGTADEVKTTITYGAPGTANNLLPTATTTASGDGSISSMTMFAYDAVGNKILEDGPLAGSADVTTWLYNADRQVTQVVGPDPDGAGPLHNRSAKTTYNIVGQPSSVSSGTSNADGSGFVELSRADTGFDSYYRKISQTVTAGGAIQARTDYSYDTLDRPSCTAVRMNPALFATLAVDACTLGTAGQFGPDRISHTVYDWTLNVSKIQSGYGTPLQRDEVTYTYPTYPCGLPASVTDADGNVTQYQYNGCYLTQINYPSPTTKGAASSTDYEQITYSNPYDYTGRVAARRLRDGKQITYSYDNLGRQTLAHMVNPVDANDRDIATSYDLLGRVTQVDDGAGKKVSFTYDALGRKLSESPQLTGGSTSYQYDAAGRRTRLTWSDGFYVSYDYDTLGELLAIRENGATSGVGVLASFAYDDQGKPTGLTRGNGVNSSYSYDTASRLQTYTINHPSAGNSYTFAYNPVGQLVSRSMSNDAYAWTQAVAVNRNYTVNGLNQYTASGSVVPTYDGRGNMTSAGSTAYVYDSKNKLTTFGSNALGYDAMGRLATQATPGTRFVYDGSDLIAETDASNTILRRYVHIPGTDNVLVWYEGSDTSSRRWLAHDERMSTTLITDASGTSLGINAYDEYGIPQSTNLGRFQYTGQAWLPELGMYYYKARIYSPTMGRFMQTDPKGYDDGTNWYNYVHGDPINGSDPSGEVCLLNTAPSAQMISQCVNQQINSQINNSVATSYYSNFMENSRYERYGSLIPDSFNKDAPSKPAPTTPSCQLCAIAGGAIGSIGEIGSTTDKANAILGGTLDAITGYNTKFEFLDETTAGALEFSSKGLTILSALGSYSELRADGFGYTRSIAGGGVGAALGLGEMSILSPIITPLGAAGITAAMSVTGANSYLVKQTVTFDRAAEKLPPRGGIPLAIIPF